MKRKNRQPDPGESHSPELSAHGNTQATASLPVPAMPHSPRSWGVALGLMALLTLGMFADVLFTGQPVVLSNRSADTAHQFLHWRAFGFGEMKQGHFPLWNPHIFSGTPYFGGFQSALLYPLNALFLVLPVDRAINWSIALHVFLAGAFAYGWAARRGLQPPACFITGIVLMFCGAHFLHIYAGHLPNLCTMVWVPLLFTAIDGQAEKPGPGWILTGVFTTAMMIMAGHPQYVYYAGLTAVLYCALQLPRMTGRLRFLGGLALMAVGGAALSAVQLFTSLQEAPEMLRSMGMSYTVASGYSFPPENFLTLLAPDLFGDLKAAPYWGEGLLWEACLFVGIAGLVLAVVGAVCGERRARRFSITMIIVLLLLALGKYTPFFKVMYYAVPGFSSFRGTTKFIFPASLFIAMLAGIGFNELMKGVRVPRYLVVSAGVAGLLLITAGVLAIDAGVVTTGEGRHVLALGGATTRTTWFLGSGGYNDPAFLLNATHVAGRSLLTSGAMFVLVTALLLFHARKQSWALWTLLAVAVVELFLFARQHLDTFDPGLARNQEIQSFLDSHPGDYRILNEISANACMSYGTFGLWGYDPGILRRYAELLAFTEGVAPDVLAQSESLSRRHPLLALFRYRFTFTPTTEGINILQRGNYLPHVLLVQQCRVLTNRDDIFAAMTNADFTPRQEVILKSRPNPLPQLSDDPGSAQVVEAHPGHLTIRAEVKQPAILLVTDNYARGWRVQALSDSSQQHYDILPADYCLRAVPLAAGSHWLRMDYRPSGFVVGRWVSGIALVIFLGLSAACFWKRFAPVRRDKLCESPIPKEDGVSGPRITRPSDL